VINSVVALSFRRMVQNAWGASPEALGGGSTGRRPGLCAEETSAMSKASDSRGPAMSGDFEEAWSTIPTKALHPVRVPMIEAFWRIDEPLSAIDLVDVLDGFLSMWEAAHHLRVLETLNVVEPDPVETSRTGSRRDQFGLRRRLKREAG
jgi:hypothetical protein